MTDQDALDSYLIWELCKKRGIQKTILEGSTGEENLKNKVEELRKEYNEKDYECWEKIELMQELDSNPGYRTEVFQRYSWKKETVKIEKVGTTLPRAGDLPPKVISGALPEVVEFVRGADLEEYQSVKYIKSLKQAPKILEKFSP